MNIQKIADIIQYGKDELLHPYDTACLIHQYIFDKTANYTHEVELKFVEKGDFIKVESNGKGLLNHLTTGRSYEIEKMFPATSYLSDRRFKIINDIGKPKYYKVTQSCWFTALRFKK